MSPTYKRWYDHDPLLLEVIELLRNYQTELRAQAEIFLAKIEEKVSKETVEKFYQMTKETSANNRWYDKDPVISRTVELLRIVPPEAQKICAENFIRTLKEILIYARDNYEYDNKIVSKIQLYKVEKVISKTIAESNFWTFEEFNKFIKVVDKELYFIIFNFLYYTGLRIGEMIALTWNDINFTKKQVRVNKTFTDKVLNDTYKITTPKTNNSIRYVDIDENLLKLLIKHREKEEKIYNFKEEMFVFGNVTHIAPTTLKRYLYKYIEIAKVKKITPHGFRHSHVSLLINLGCDSRDVAERVGDTIQMVEKTYYHMFPAKKKKTVNLLNNIKKQGINKG